MQGVHFDYFRGMEADQYTFFRIPKILFTAECFSSLSCEAKVLYGLLLDRMSLSIKNRWLDKESRVYIIFTVDEIAELMGCGTQKAVKLLKELDVEKGIGLIEKKRLGLGRPNVIYIKNFLIQQTENQKTEIESEGDTIEIQNCENHHSRIVKITNQEYPESQIRDFENQNSGISGIKSPEFPKSQFKNDENHNSGIVKITNPEFPKSKSNDTDINDTELNENKNSETKSIYPDQISSCLSKTVRGSDVIEKMETCRNVIREHIFYECFQDERYHCLEKVDELVELIVEVMMMPDNRILRIAGVEKSAAIVKNRFMKLRKMHIEYVLTCLDANTSKVGNIKSYLLTALYNAPMTISNYYAAEVNHDLYGSG